MSAKERDRLKVLHEVHKRHIPQRQAAVELGVSERWVRKLLVRWRARGDGALRHGLRGRPSNRKMPDAVKRRAVELYRKNQQTKLWHDYGPTLAAEELAQKHGIVISRETMRQWLMGIRNSGLGLPTIALEFSTASRASAGGLLAGGIPSLTGTCGTCHDTPNVGNHSFPTLTMSG